MNFGTVKCKTCREGFCFHVANNDMTDHSICYESAKTAKAAAERLIKQVGMASISLTPMVDLLGQTVKEAKLEPPSCAVAILETKIRAMKIKSDEEVKPGNVVKVIKGTFKGLAGLVLWTTDTHVMIELQAKMKTIRFSKNQVKAVDPSTLAFL